MDISPRKPLKRTSEPVDDWLHNEGYFRKRAPRDPTCLFRAVSEQIYSTQHYHIRVRRECVEYMRTNSQLFERSVNIAFESYLEQMSCFTEWGGPNEIQAMSLLYKREFVIFNGQKLVVRTVTNNGFKDTIYLCHTSQKQYESVYARDILPTAAFCQSLVYQTLYKDVFKMSDVDNTVQKMLHDRSNNFRHDKFFLKGNLEIREQLTTELLTKIETGCEENEDGQSICKGVTPFPYRVAKALDPNIYRNTDFDIWHEIRREVRNAGWTKWNGTDLQVGGECLVQVDFNENEYDESNNNYFQVNGDKDSNGNASKKGKRKPTFWYGHIQEMSKDEGPVVVFIVELGEKRTFPFAALKPLAARTAKQNCWSLTTSRRNSGYESNQKGKKSWNSRKLKDSVSNANHGTNNIVDRNNNSSKLDNDVKIKDNGNIELWDEEPSEQKKTSILKSYTMETYNSYQGFPIENTIDVRPVTVVLDHPPPTMNSSMQKNTEDYNKNLSKAAKNNGSNDNVDKASPNVGSVAPDSIIQPLQQVSIQPATEAFYQPHPGMPPMFPNNLSMFCGSPDGNSYPPFPFFTGEPPAPGSLLDRTFRAVNFSAPLSVDASGNDLPFSDTVTLRFFYNLGVNIYRASCACGYGTNGQPMTLGPNFIPQGNLLPPNVPVDGTQATITNDDEGTRGVNGLRSNYPQSRRRGDYTSNAGKTNSNNQQQLSKTFNNRKNDMQESHGQRNEASKPIGDSYRSQSYFNNDRNKDHPNGRKNGAASRYKKHSEGRNWNTCPPNLFQPDQQSPPAIYQSNSGNMEPPAFQGIKNDPGQQGSMPIPPGLQSASQTPSSGGNPGAFPSPYGPQTVYTVPYYPSDGDAFYAPGPGFYPVPYVTHPDMADGNNANTFPAPIYPAGAENYAQPIPAVYPPYMYQQQAIYSALPPQNCPENWYALPGQPQFMQYPQIPPPQPGPTPNGAPTP